MKNKFKISVFVAALSVPFAVQAGGLHLYEIGTTDLGLAAAGQAARADDASTIYGNPAGMTRLSGHQLSMGWQGRNSQANYTQDGSGVLTPTGADPGNVGGYRDVGSFFYSHSVSDRLKLGIGMYGNYGMELDFGTWAGSRLVEEAYTKAASIQPSAAYRINEQWSVGGGLVLSYGMAKLKRTENNVTYDEDDQDWSHGWRLGVLFEPTASTRVGFVWQNKIQHNYEMDWQSTPWAVLARGMEKAVRPEERMLSIWHRVNPDWAVMGNLGWQGWSKFTNEGMENRSNAAYPGDPRLEMQDTWHIAIGTQYMVNANTKWNIGTAYDTSFYKHQSDTTLLMPNGAVWRVGTGIQYKLNKESELGFALGYLRAESSTEQNRFIKGGYDHPEIYFGSLQFMHKF